VSARVAAWWREVDRLALAALLALLAGGLLCALAASPAAADRLGIEAPFAFLTRYAGHAGLAAALIVSVSMLSSRSARRLAALVLLAAIVLLALTPFIGVEANEARRWLRLGSLSLQPAELVMPAFVVTAAWLLAEGRRTGARGPASVVVVAAFAVIAALLLAQPDAGRLAVLAATFVGLLFLAGASWRLMAGLAAAGAGLVALVVLSPPGLAAWLQGLLGVDAGDRAGLALEAIRRGGLFGVGPGEGLIKQALPDAHGELIFAVATEEFGLVFTLALVGLLAAVVVRLIARARLRGTDTEGLAAGGLALLIGVQALVNLSANLNLAPPLGVTLPLLSYGGSSLTALGLAGGLALCFTRRPAARAAADAVLRRSWAERSA
jgi:cell division protein FtsW